MNQELPDEQIAQRLAVTSYTTTLRVRSQIPKLGRRLNGKPNHSTEVSPEYVLHRKEEEGRVAYKMTVEGLMRGERLQAKVSGFVDHLCWSTEDFLFLPNAPSAS